jgi:hypothetical protein
VVAWTQFTWAPNAAATTHPAIEAAIEAVVLAGTAPAFLLAAIIPDTLADAGGWVAATYVAVRVVGLAPYGRVARDDPAKRTAVRRLALPSAGGLAAVAGGALAGGTPAGGGGRPRCCWTWPPPRRPEALSGSWAAPHPRGAATATRCRAGGWWSLAPSRPGLARPGRPGQLVAAGGGPGTAAAGRGGASDSDRERVQASLSAAPSPARSAE